MTYADAQRVAAALDMNFLDDADLDDALFDLSQIVPKFTWEKGSETMSGYYPVTVRKTE